MKRNWFVAAIVIGIVSIVIAAVAMRLSDDGTESTAKSPTPSALVPVATADG